MLPKLRARFSNLRANAFVRHVGTLASGTVLGRLISLIALPLLTRLYPPEDFAVLATYLAVLTTIASVACLRLEIAIPLPKDDTDAANLLAVALLSSTLLCALMALGVLYAAPTIATLAKLDPIASDLWLLPLGVWVLATYTALQFWATRQRRFNTIAKTRISQSAIGTSVMLGLGWAAIAPIGLIIGHMLTAGAGFIGLARDAVRHESSAISRISLSRMRKVLRDYKRFPKFSTFEALANIGAIQIPVVIIANVASGPEAGFLFLAMQIMLAPISLIASSIGQVYLSRAPHAYRDDQLPALTGDVLATLLRVGVGPLLFIGVVAPAFFPFVFGANWARAGTLVAWIAPSVAMQFLASPISMALHITGHQVTAAKVQVFGLFMRIGAVLAATTLLPGREAEAFALSGFAFYIVYLYAIIKVVGLHDLPTLRRLVANASPLVFWIIFAVILAALLDYLIAT